MTIQLLDPLEPLSVDTVPVLLYGGPGVGKTCLAQTASNPLTLDFDVGIHRAFNRKMGARFQTWDDVIDAQNDGVFDPYDTLVIDTGGRALDTMIPGILKESPKNGYQGNLSPQGWGILGGRFTTWMKLVRALRKQVVFVCHQEESTDAAGNPYFKPDLPGKMSLKEIHKSFDLIGRVRHEGRKRLLDFAPSENQLAKDAAQLGAVEIGELANSPTFLADLIELAKQRIGLASQASAETANTVNEWRAYLDADPTVNDINGRLSELASMTKAAKKQVWALIEGWAKKAELTFDKSSKVFTR